MRLDILEKLARQLRETLASVADDLGLGADDADGVELVDLVSGSAGLVFEQTVSHAAIVAPLDIALDAVIARGSGRPPPRILTQRGLRQVDDLVRACDEIRRRGVPVSIQMSESPGEDAPAPDRWTEAVWPDRRPVPLFALRDTRAVSIVEAPATLEAPGELPPVVDSERETWIVRFTGKVERLDKRKLEMWVRLDAKLKELRLSAEQFATVDGEDARWKTVLVTVTATTPDVERVTEVLHVTPATEDVALEAIPVNEAARLLAPVLERVKAFANLQKGWDSYSAAAIKPGAIRAAAAFLVLAASELRVRGVSMIAPFCAPVSRGSVQVEWEDDGKYLEIEFVDERQIEYMRSVGDLSAEGVTEREKALELAVWFHLEHAE